MLIKHKIGLSFLAIFLLLGALITMEFFHDVGNAEQIAIQEATAIAQTMALNLAHLTEAHHSFSPEAEAAILQSIKDFKNRQKRDIVVVDTSQKIIADAILNEIGSIFIHDPNDEVGQTLRDGMPRVFNEVSTAYPEGIKQLVIPLDLSSEERLGALILEYTPLYKSIVNEIKQNAATHMVFYTTLLSTVLLAIYVYAQKLAATMKSMQHAAREIAEGKSEVKIPYAASDELGELAASFNRMAKDVTGVRKDLLDANEQLQADIETRQKVEEALIESEQKLRALLDAIPDMILFKDAEGRHQLANKAALDALGGADNLIGKMVEDILPPDAAKKCRLNDEEVMCSHKIRQDEESIPGHHGKPMYIDTIRVPLYDARNNQAGLVVIVRDITEKKAAEEHMLASLREKDVLLREIHHRVKNNLAIVNSLLRLQSGMIENEGVRDVFVESQNRIKAMALVHEKLFSEGNLSRVSFESYVKKLVIDICKSLKANMNQVKTEFNVEDVLLDIDTLIPCGLIINELVTNSLKHALTGSDPLEIDISLVVQEGDKLSLVVADNGCGLPEDMEIQNSPSLGFQIVQSLVTQLQGVIQLARENGTMFEILFPKERQGGTNHFYTI